MDPYPNPPSLSYISLNPFSQSPFSPPSAAPTTILLLHGAGSSPTEYALTTPHIPASAHHILIPALPRHGSSAHIQPFTLAHTSSLLAALVRTHAINGKAHIVGVSLGAHVALHFAANYPDAVCSLFVSGFGRVREMKGVLGALAPWVVSAVRRAENAVPRWLVGLVMDGAGLDSGGTSRYDVQLCREVLAVLSGAGEGERERDEDDTELRWGNGVKARTLVVAATKRGVVPSNDSVEEAIGVGKRIREAGGDVKVVEMKSMRHPWDMVAPELFARCVLAWVGERELLGEMEELEV